MSNKVRVPERVSYRVDHADMGEWFYAEVFGSEKEAQDYIDDRNPKYRDKLKIVRYVEPEHDSYHLGTIRL